MFPLLLVTAQTCYFLSLTLGMMLSPPYTCPPRLILPWGKFLSYFHYSLGTALIPVSFYPGDHAKPQFTIHYSLDTSLTIWHHRMTFFHLLLFYFCRITENRLTLNTSASAPSVSVSYKALGLSPQSYWYLGFRVVITETEIKWWLPGSREKREWRVIV